MATIMSARVLSALIGAVGLDEQIEQALGLPADVARDGEGFAIGLPGHHQRQIDRELHRRAGADRPAMLEPAAELIRGSAWRARHPPAPRPSGRAACPAAPARSSRRPGIPRTPRPWRAPSARARVSTFGGTVLISMNSLPFTSPDKQTVRPVVDGVDRRGVGEHGDDGFAALGKLGRRRRHFGAGIGQRLGFVRRAIPHRDLMADFHQPRRNRRAHGAETCNTNLHTSSRIAFAADDRRSRRALESRLPA